MRHHSVYMAIFKNLKNQPTLCQWTVCHADWRQFYRFQKTMQRLFVRIWQPRWLRCTRLNFFTQSFRWAVFQFKYSRSNMYSIKFSGTDEQNLLARCQWLFVSGDCGPCTGPLHKSMHGVQSYASYKHTLREMHWSLFDNPLTRMK